jgi:hypothetical protein
MAAPTVRTEPLTHGLSSDGILIEDQLESRAAGHLGVSLAAVFGDSPDCGLASVVYHPPAKPGQGTFIAATAPHPSLHSSKMPRLPKQAEF